MVYCIVMTLQRENPGTAELEPEVLKRTTARLHPGENDAFEYMMGIRARELIKYAEWFNKAK